MNTCNYNWEWTTCKICPMEQWGMILSINKDKNGISSVKTGIKCINQNFAQEGWTEMLCRVFQSMQNSEYYSHWRIGTWKHCLQQCGDDSWSCYLFGEISIYFSAPVFSSIKCIEICLQFVNIHLKSLIVYVPAFHLKCILYNLPLIQHSAVPLFLLFHAVLVPSSCYNKRILKMVFHCIIELMCR